MMKKQLLINWIIENFFENSENSRNEIYNLVSKLKVEEFNEFMRIKKLFEQGSLTYNDLKLALEIIRNNDQGQNFLILESKDIVNPVKKE